MAQKAFKILFVVLMAQISVVIGASLSEKWDQMIAAGVSREFLESLPKALVPIGTFEEFGYWQETNEMRTQEQSRVYCEMFGMHLARFPNNNHVEFVYFESGPSVDQNWADGIGSFSRSVYKWGNGGAIAADIPIDPYENNVGLRIHRDNHGLRGALTSELEPCICQLHIIPELPGPDP